MLHSNSSVKDKAIAFPVNKGVPYTYRAALLLSMTLFWFFASAQTSVFINEIHYDNSSSDVNEGVEIAGPAGTDLTGWTLVKYNGSNNLVYGTNALSGVIPDEGSGFGALNFLVGSNGLQNGSPDGVALVDDAATVVQFLSYEGTITAGDGAAMGMTSEDIGVAESGTTLIDNALQLTGTGACYEDFTWQAPAAHSRGLLNTGQTMTGTCGMTMASGSVFINEIHYDNSSSDVNEGVEIAGPAGTDLTGWTLVKYNGSNNLVYGTNALSGVIPDEGSGFGALNFLVGSNGLQNGSPDGVALVDDAATVIQFLSYEGTITAGDGAAMGMTSEDIGVAESGTTLIDNSLQLTGTGACYEDFTWQAPAAHSRGLLNTGQTMTGTCGDAPSVSLVINEIHADPAGDITGDANGDGVRDFSEDEFVELVNIGSSGLDISGWTLSDGVGVKHIFPGGSVVSAGCAIVVFGGATPIGDFGYAVVQTASSGSLSLNNGGDDIIINDGGSDVLNYSYGGEGGDNQSLTRDPDIIGTDPLVKHTLAAGSGGALFSPGTLVDGTNFSGCTAPPHPLIINEIHADPDATNGDANGDGIVSTTQDEFFELVNNGSSDLDISNWTMTDGCCLRHTFPNGTAIPANCAIVVFSGGNPTGTFGNALVQTASTGSLGLNNGGDIITINDGSSDIVSASYGGEGGDDQSLTRDPDISGPFVKHSVAIGSGGTLFSPGTMVDGSNFSGCTAPPCGFSVNSVTATCNSSNPGPGDTYDLFIDYAGIDPGTSVDYTGSGTVGGDDPAAVADGIIVINGIDEAENYTVSFTGTCASVVISGPAPICEPSPIVINEVDYDNVGTDDREYIELYNASNAPYDLSGTTLELVNGSNNSIYNTIALDNIVLAPGDYHVICGNGGNVANCDQVLPQFSNIIQNGPDAIGFRNVNGVLRDAVSYEGDVPGYTETAGVSPGDNNSDTLISISRAPNGSDGNNNNADFIIACITPGEANAPDALFCVCEPPTAAASTSCIDEFTFNILIDLTDLGDAATVDITNNLTSSSALGVTVGIHSIGPFNNGDIVDVLIAHDEVDECDVTLVGVTEYCPPANDACFNATTLSCGGTGLGDTNGAEFDDIVPCGDATNSAPGIWYAVTGTGEIFVVSTDNPGTDYDTQLSVFETVDDEFGNELSCILALNCVDGNDDIDPGINLASQIAWTSVLGQNYLVLVTGSGSATGHSEISLDCVDPLVLESTTGCQSSYIGFDPAEGPNYIQACVTGGTQPYTFDWVQVSPPPAPSTILFTQDDGICADAAVQPTASGCTTYSVVVTDANGIQMAEFIDVCQVDLECSNNSNTEKVLICHDGNTLCVSENAALMHIAHGDSYGPCDNDCDESLPPIDQGSAGPIGGGALSTEVKEGSIEVYPNPTSGIANLQFTVAEAGVVDIALYSMDGKKVDQIYNGNVEAGVMNVTGFDAKSLPNGVYLYQLISNNTVLSGRLQITR